MPSKEIWLEGERFLRAADARLVPLFDRYGPCTLEPVSPEEYFSTLVRGILSQQVAPAVGTEFYRSFTACFGEAPAPAALAEVQAAQLAACGFSLQKAEYIKDLAAAVAAGKVDFGSFAAMADGAIVKQLTEVKGVGRWTAEIFLILALGRPDVLPAEDFGLKKAMKEFLQLPALPQKRSEVASLAEQWQPWRSLATWYFWQYFAGL